jgi:hypothetical protein
MEQTKIDFTLAEEAAPAMATRSARPTFSEPLSRDSRPPPKGRSRK